MGHIYEKIFRKSTEKAALMAVDQQTQEKILAKFDKLMDENTRPVYTMGFRNWAQFSVRVMIRTTAL